MTVVLDSKPATAEDVAKILGIPKARVKWLKKLVDARTDAPAKTNGKGLAFKAERKKAAYSESKKRSRGGSKKATR